MIAGSPSSRSQGLSHSESLLETRHPPTGVWTDYFPSANRGIVYIEEEGDEEENSPETEVRRRSDRQKRQASQDASIKTSTSSPSTEKNREGQDWCAATGIDIIGRSVVDQLSRAVERRFVCIPDCTVVGRDAEVVMMSMSQWGNHRA